MGGLGVPICEVEMPSTFQGAWHLAAMVPLPSFYLLMVLLAKQMLPTSVGSGKKGPPVARGCGLSFEAIPRLLFPGYGQDFASPRKSRKLEAEGDEVT